MSDTEDTKEHNDIEKPKTPSDTKDDTENQEVYYLLWKQFTSLNNLITYKRTQWPFLSVLREYRGYRIIIIIVGPVSF